MLYAEADHQPQHRTNPPAFVVQVLLVLVLVGYSVAFPNAAHMQPVFMQSSVNAACPFQVDPYP